MSDLDVARWMLVLVIWLALLLGAFVIVVIAAAILGFIGYWVFAAAVGGFKFAEHM